MNVCQYKIDDAILVCEWHFQPFRVKGRYQSIFKIKESDTHFHFFKSFNTVIFNQFFFLERNTTPLWVCVIKILPYLSCKKVPFPVSCMVSQVASWLMIMDHWVRVFSIMAHYKKQRKIQIIFFATSKHSSLPNWLCIKPTVRIIKYIWIYVFSVVQKYTCLAIMHPA